MLFRLDVPLYASIDDESKLKLAEFFLNFPCASPVMNSALEALAFSFAFDSFL